MKHNRLQTITELLARRGYMSVVNLAKAINVSDMTIRRDLEILEREGSIRRIHGGAYIELSMLEVDYNIRETVELEKKKSIGNLAFSIIQPGESIYIDAGSTTSFLASSIDDTKRLTVVTHSIVVAQALINRINVETILIGGKLHAGTKSLIGPLAEESVGKFRYTKAFLGTSGVNLTEGLTISTLEEVSIKRSAALNSKQVVVLADSSKFNKEVFAFFLELDQIDILISDWDLSEKHKSLLEEKGIQVLTANSDES